MLKLISHIALYHRLLLKFTENVFTEIICPGTYRKLVSTLKLSIHIKVFNKGPKISNNTRYAVGT